jgi:predicted nucleotidyltransferase
MIGYILTIRRSEGRVKITKWVTVMNLQTIRNDYREQILAIANKCQAESIKVFGSVARGSAKPSSDVDFLVHMKPDSGFAIGGLQWRLEELLGCKVDVVPDTCLHHRIKDRVLREAVSI